MAEHDEERPPIIVEQGSLIFDAGVKTTRMKSCKGEEDETRVELTWKKDLIGMHWKPNQPKGKSVRHFSVTAFGTVTPCECRSATRIEITYELETGKTVTVPVYRGIGLHHREPKVDLSGFSGRVDVRGRHLTVLDEGRLASLTLIKDKRSTLFPFARQAGRPQVIIKPMGSPEGERAATVDGVLIDRSR